MIVPIYSLTSKIWEFYLFFIFFADYWYHMWLLLLCGLHSFLPKVSFDKYKLLTLIWSALSLFCFMASDFGGWSLRSLCLSKFRNISSYVVFLEISLFYFLSLELENSSLIYSWLWCELKRNQDYLFLPMESKWPSIIYGKYYSFTALRYMNQWLYLDRSVVGVYKLYTLYLYHTAFIIIT